MSESDYYPDKNVSKVIGIATLLVVTVLLAALIGSVFLGLDFGLFDRGNEVSQAAFDFEETDDSLLIEPLAVNEGNEIAVVKGSTGETVMTIDAEDVGNIINLAEEHDITLKKGEMINLVNLVTGELVAQHEVSSNIGNEDEEEPDGTVSTGFTNSLTTRGATATTGTIQNSVIRAPENFYSIENPNGLTLPLNKEDYIKVTDFSISMYNARTNSLLAKRDHNVGDYKKYSMDDNLLVLANNNNFESYVFNSITEVEDKNTSSSIVDVYVKDNNYYVLTESSFMKYSSNGNLVNEFSVSDISNFNIVGIENMDNIYGISGNKLIKGNLETGNIKWERSRIVEADYNNGHLYAYFNTPENRIEKIDTSTGSTIKKTEYAYSGGDIVVGGGKVHYKAATIFEPLKAQHPEKYELFVSGQLTVNNKTFDYYKGSLGYEDFYVGENHDGGYYQSADFSHQSIQLEYNNNGLIVGDHPEYIQDLTSVSSTYRPVGGHGYVKDSFINMSFREKLSLTGEDSRIKDTGSLYKDVLSINETISVEKVHINANIKGSLKEKQSIITSFMFINPSDNSINDPEFGIGVGKGYEDGKNWEILNGEYGPQEYMSTCIECDSNTYGNWTIKPGRYTVVGLIGGEGSDGTVDEAYHSVDATVAVDSIKVYYKTDSGEKGEFKLSASRGYPFSTGEDESNTYPDLRSVDIKGDYSGERYTVFEEKFDAVVYGGSGQFKYDWSSTRPADKKPRNDEVIYNYTSSDKGEFTVALTVTDERTGKTVTETKTFSIKGLDNAEMISARNYQFTSSPNIYPGSKLNLGIEVDNSDGNKIKKYYSKLSVDNNSDSVNGYISSGDKKVVNIETKLPEKSGLYTINITRSSKSQEQNNIPIFYTKPGNLKTDKLVNSNNDTFTYSVEVFNPTESSDTIIYEGTVNGQTISETIQVEPGIRKTANLEFDTPTEGSYTMYLKENGFKIPKPINIDVVDGVKFNINSITFEKVSDGININSQIYNNGMSGTDNVNIKVGESVIKSEKLSLENGQNGYVNGIWEVNSSGSYEVKVSTDSDNMTKNIQISEEVAVNVNDWSKNEINGNSYSLNDSGNILIQEYENYTNQIIFNNEESYLGYNNANIVVDKINNNEPEIETDNKREIVVRIYFSEGMVSDTLTIDGSGTYQIDLKVMKKM